MKITGRIEHGELDQNSRRISQRIAQLGVQELGLGDVAKGGQDGAALGDGDGRAILPHDDEGAVGLDHLGAAGPAADDGALGLLQSGGGLGLGGVLHEGEGHVATVAADLDVALAVLDELASQSGLQSDIVLGFRQARAC